MIPNRFREGNPKMTILEFQKKVADALNGLPLPSIITLMATN